MFSNMDPWYIFNLLREDYYTQMKSAQIKVITVLIWLVALPGCLVTSGAISDVVNKEPEGRQGATEVRGDAEVGGFFPVVFLPEGDVEQANISLKREAEGTLFEERKGTLMIQPAQLEAVNKSIALEQGDIRGRLEIENSEGDPVMKLRAEDEAGFGVVWITSWYTVSEDGRGWSLQAVRRQEFSILLPLLLAILLTLVPAFVVTRLLKKKVKPAESSTPKADTI